ncbi:MAG TPA: tRNA-uridine aminocarboxypropyltransferase [Stellaceae bacterium]
MGNNHTTAAGQTLDNRLFVLILQHPREQKGRLATAGLLAAMLRQVELAVGLSWPNLARLIGGRADPGRWAVLYLGSARPAAFGAAEVVALDRRGAPEADQKAALDGLDGVVLLDGSWSEAKALWWRNPWLLKLRRLVLNPRHRSRLGRVRREPRREALSTLEAAALLLRVLDNRPDIEAALTAALDRLIAEARPGRATAVQTGFPL